MATNDTEIPERLVVENIEIVFLVFVVSLALILNSMVFIQLLTNKKKTKPRPNNTIQKNSFFLFKLNLCISDFCILLIYATGKLFWLTTFEWKLGDTGCKIYKLLSSFSFYANSNIIVAIAYDRFKVVYTSQIQGATSVIRVKCLLIACWLLAFLCALPQFFTWKTIQIGDNWDQCVTVFTMHFYQNTTTPAIEQRALFYEISHQLTVFWIPLLIILVCYLLIVVKLLSYNIKPSDMFSSDAFDNEESYSLKSLPAGEQILLTAPINSVRRWSTRIQKKVSTSTRNNSAHSTSEQRTFFPTWRTQLGSQVFRSACLIILTHVVLWLPYNTISATRFVNEEFYQKVMENGGNFLEDLIIVNCFLNPLLYTNRKRAVRRNTPPIIVN